MARWWIDKVFPFERQILAAARPIARSLLDISAAEPGGVRGRPSACRENLIAMNEILRDREHCTVRLVMNPDRMVIGEAMRTFTYLNLYGYLTDAVIVNRVFPAEVGDYFAPGAGSRRSSSSSCDSAFCAGAGAVRAVLRPGGARSRDARPARRGAVRRRDRRPPSCTTRITQELEIDADGACCGSRCRSPRKGDISLKKIGLELIVGVDGQKRTIVLPPAMAGFRPTGATFEEGALEVRFDG